MFHLAEKVRVVGGNPVNEKTQLLLAGGRPQQVAVFGVTGKLKLAQPLGEARGDQDFFVPAQMDAAPLVNQTAEEIKILFRELTGVGGKFHAQSFSEIIIGQRS